MIYLIKGYTGEYEEHEEWIVAAYTDRALADQHLAGLQDYCQRSKDYANGEKRDAFIKGNYWDPSMELGYTGTWYYLEEVSIRTEVPTEPKQPEAYGQF